jgi:Uma2 family endonuclease
MGVDAAFERLRPPEDGFQAEDLDRMPDLPAHTELIDGSLVLVSPQKLFHFLVLEMLMEGLRRTTPADLRVRREMSVTLGRRQRPEPDLVVVRASAEADTDLTSYPPEAVELAVEVVSPESEERDRHRKPQLYAQAGIPHFWRVEKEHGGPVVYVYKLDPATSAYGLTGIHQGTLKVDMPYTVEIDLTRFDRL